MPYCCIKILIYQCSQYMRLLSIRIGMNELGKSIKINFYELLFFYSQTYWPMGLSLFKDRGFMVRHKKRRYCLSIAFLFIMSLRLTVEFNTRWVRNSNAVLIKGFFDRLFQIKHHVPIMIRVTPNAALNIDRTII